MKYLLIAILMVSTIVQAADFSINFSTPEKVCPEYATLVPKGENNFDSFCYQPMGGENTYFAKLIEDGNKDFRSGWKICSPSQMSKITSCSENSKYVITGIPCNGSSCPYMQCNADGTGFATGWSQIVIGSTSGFFKAIFCSN